MSALVSDDEVDVLFTFEQGYEGYSLSLVFHHLGEVMENVPVLLVAETADDADAFHLVDVVYLLLAGCGFEVADYFLAMDFFDEVEHIFVFYV